MSVTVHAYRSPRYSVSSRWAVRSPWAERSAGQWIGWTARAYGRELEIVQRSDQARGFQVLPRRGVVERTLSWSSYYRRWSKDDEYWEMVAAV